jgi:PAS domain S-box-containing protein
VVRRRRSVPEGGSVALLRVVDALPYGVLVADGNADAQQANRAWEQLTGQRGESWREHGWLLAAPADLRDRVRDDVLGDVRAGIAHVAEWTVRDPVGMDDETLAGGRVLELEVQPVFEAGALKWIVATAIDVTSQRDRVRQLVEQATRDPLTGLYNRSVGNQSSARRSSSSTSTS